MFRFVRPIWPLAAIACFWQASWVLLEILSINQAGVVANFLPRIRDSSHAKELGFLRWVSSAEPAARELRWLVLVLGVLVICYALLRYLREVANTKMSMNMVFYIREAVYDKLQRVGFGFHDALTSGQIINRALSDLQNVRQFVQTAILTTLEIVLVVVGCIILIGTRNVWVAALALLPLPIWTWYILRFSKVIQPAAKSVMEAEDKNISIITENIAGVHVVKSFATERQEIGKYAENCDVFKSRVLRRIRLFANFNPVIRSIAQASYLTLFFAGGYLMLKGKMAAGDMLILGGAMGAILNRLQQVATINEQYQNAIVSAQRLHEVLAATATVPERAGARDLAPGPGAVAFDDVTFGYSPEKSVLKNVSFEARGGSIVAIVGPTGAGKSTLVNLIARFYDPQQGKIRLDGVDLRDVTLGSLRTQVAFVFQETYLFSDTVAANVAYGRPGITGGEIEAASRLAQAHEFIETMQKGYDTLLSERGSSLSGGQKQRLAIARAIVTNPRVLILDDATAAIDPETEDLIRRGMHFVMRGRTTFVIAHRISTAKRADMVIVLEHGRIAQTGTHDELMQQDGHYREIAEVQLYADDDERRLKRTEHPAHMERVQEEHTVAAAKMGLEETEPPGDEGMGG
jgi:ATP-binding cassette subfamily B protein